MEEGFAGLLREKTRPPRSVSLGPDVAERVVALTMRNPPGEVTHWIGATMASCSISASVVRRIRRPEARIVPPTRV